MWSGNTPHSVVQELLCGYVHRERSKDLRDVLHVTGSLVRWMDLGVELGLSYSTLEAIEVERCKRVNGYRRDMFVAWL